MIRIKAHSSFIQVRAGKGTEKNIVYVKGYASMPNKVDLYNYIKLPNGKKRTFKSLFTESCIEDMKKQLMNKSVFVDGMHEIATNLGIMNLAKKYNFTDEDKHDVESALKMKRLPLAKVTEFDIDDNGLIIATETNPHFAKVDDEHRQYYESITGSLLDGYLKGYSINFDPIEFTTEVDGDGNQLDRISKVDLFGMSYTDSQALPDNQFTEVCMRSLGNFMKVRNMQGTEGTEGKEPVKDNTPKNDPQPKVDIEAEIQKRVQAELDKKAKEQEDLTIKEQLETQKKMIEELKAGQEKKVDPPKDPLKPAGPGSNPGTSIVPQLDKYGNPVPNENNQEVTNQEGMEALKEIKEPIDRYMAEVRRPTSNDQIGVKQVYGQNGFHEAYGRLMALQHEFQLHRSKMPGETDDQFLQRQTILNDKNSDMAISHKGKF